MTSHLCTSEKVAEVRSGVGSGGDEREDSHRGSVPELVVSEL